MRKGIEKQIELLVGIEFKVENYNLIRTELEDLMDSKGEKVLEYEDLVSYYSYLLEKYNQFLDIKESLKN